MPAAAEPPSAAPAEPGAKPAPAPEPIDRALDRYLRHLQIERGLSQNTLAAYRRDLAAFREVLRERGKSTPSSLTRADVTAFLAHIGGRTESPMAPSSLARMLSSVRGLSRFLVDEGLAAEDVTAETAPPKLPFRLPKAISIEQMASVLAATDGDEPQALRDKALLELLYATGARISEAVALNVDDVISDTGSSGELIRVLGKGNKQRIVPLGSFARAALDAYLVRARPVFSPRGPSTPALFLGARGARISRQNAWLIIRAAAERANLGIDISPHTFRHSFATHLLTGGADVRVVQELLGHASVSTTQLYTLVTADALRDMYTTAHPRAR
jgi:integrase/recombinase XerD